MVSRKSPPQRAPFFGSPLHRLRQPRQELRSPHPELGITLSFRTLRDELLFIPLHLRLCQSAGRITPRCFEMHPNSLLKLLSLSPLLRHDRASGLALWRSGRANSRPPSLPPNLTSRFFSSSLSGGLPSWFGFSLFSSISLRSEPSASSVSRPRSRYSLPP